MVEGLPRGVLGTRTAYVRCVSVVPLERFRNESRTVSGTSLGHDGGDVESS